jgi:hypothetical protein
VGGCELRREHAITSSRLTLARPNFNSPHSQLRTCEASACQEFQGVGMHQTIRVAGHGGALSSNADAVCARPMLGTPTFLQCWKLRTSAIATGPRTPQPRPALTGYARGRVQASGRNLDNERRIVITGADLVDASRHGPMRSLSSAAGRSNLVSSLPHGQALKSAGSRITGIRS